jgi:hypothetical protein
MAHKKFIAIGMFMQRAVQKAAQDLCVGLRLSAKMPVSHLNASLLLP